MDPLENPFRKLLDHSRLPLGTWLMSGAPSTAEAMGCIGFDWLVVDAGLAQVSVAGQPDFARSLKYS